MAKKGGLGKGLDALFLDNDAQVGEGLMSLRISTIEPNKDQPRDRFDQGALSELADSIREHGVLQPIVVRSTAGGSYQIIAGERRWRAARMAGLSEIPAMVVEAEDSKVMELALIENLQREDLTIIEEALGYRTLMETYGMTQEQVARRMGKSRPVIANALRILNLSPAALKRLEDGEITPGHARVLAGLETEEEMDALAAEAVRGGADGTAAGKAGCTTEGCGQSSCSGAETVPGGKRLGGQRVTGDRDQPAGDAAPQGTNSALPPRGGAGAGILFPRGPDGAGRAVSCRGISDPSGDNKTIWKGRGQPVP